MDGLAVGWGINNKKPSWRECAEACIKHVPGPQVGGPYQVGPCGGSPPRAPSNRRPARGDLR